MASGFPILKELIQNAEDARASQIRFIAHKGWENAQNPLLRVPGLLVANDGRFEADDGDGILSFGDGTKSGETAAIGRFGFGQKAVFHLCDTFIAHAFGHATQFSEVINPCLSVIDKTQAASWDDIENDDLARLMSAVHDIPKGFLLWLPLRCDAVLPAKNLSFTDYRPRPDELVDELKSHEAELRLILAGLRHIDRISAVQEDKTTHLELSRSADGGRMRGPDESWRCESQKFHGQIEDKGEQASVYVGRESCGVSPLLDQLRSAENWPKVPDFDEDGGVMRDEKAVAHGAVILSNRKDNVAGSAEFDWGVFLPVAKAAGIELKGPGFLILLHGYFFVDSGRRDIVGFNDKSGGNNKSDGNDSIYREWNETLRDEVVLPLLPSVLHDAYQAQMLSADQLADLLAALNNSSFGREHAEAIAQRDCLVRLIEPSGSALIARWTIKPADVALRPFPTPDERGHIDCLELLPNLHKWADAKAIHLVAGPQSALVRGGFEWQADEISEILSELSSEVFLQGGKITALEKFLETTVGNSRELREAAKSGLLKALRGAMREQRSLANDDSIRRILAYLPEKYLVSLPSSASERFVLRALAAADRSPLVGRAAWVEDSTVIDQLDPSNLVDLFDCLEPLLNDERKDDAANAAAVSLLKLGKSRLEQLANSTAFLQRPVLRLHDGKGRKRLVTLPEIMDASSSERLFRDNPRVKRLMKLLSEAVPSTETLIMAGRAADLFADAETGPWPFSFTKGTADAVCKLIGQAEQFGNAQQRATLLTEVFSKEDQHRSTLRMLAAGNKPAGDVGVSLFMTADPFPGLDRILESLISHSDNKLMLGTEIADALNREQQAALGIRSLDAAELGRIMQENVEYFPSLSLSDEEVSALLLSRLDDDVLKELPIHRGKNGELSLASQLRKETQGWPIPVSLRAIAELVELSADTTVRKRQEGLIADWGPLDQIQLCLGQPEPSQYAGLILDALVALDELPEDLTNKVKSCRWLTDINRIGWSPSDVFDLGDDIEMAALKVLSENDQDQAFLPKSKISPDLRTHGGFERLHEWKILPDSDASLESLGLMIDDKKPVAFLGSAQEFPIEAAKAIAVAGLQFDLPGWPLLAAVLRQGDALPEALVRKLISSFGSVQQGEIERAKAWFEPLGGGNFSDGHGGAALCLFSHGIKGISTWEAYERNKAIAGLRVPTSASSWREASQVVAGAEGVSNDHLLHSKLIEYFARPAQGPEVSVAMKPKDSSETAEIHDLSSTCLISLETLIGKLQNTVPDQMLYLLIALTGRSLDVQPLVDKIHSTAGRTFDEVRRSLDDIINDLAPDTVIDSQHFVFHFAEGGMVECTSILGERIKVPTLSDNATLILGNSHYSSATSDNTSPIKVTINSGLFEKGSHTDFSTALSGAIVTLAKDSLGFEASHLTALQRLVDVCRKVDQATVQEVQRLMTESLPFQLEQLKLPKDSGVREMLVKYQRKEEQAARSGGDLASLRRELWRDIESPEATRELLAAMRERISDYGYSSSRVFFELFQNADDAYQQLGGETGSFRVEVSKQSLRIVHWGRLINHLGPNPKDGENRGYGRDLINMLKLNVSEKRSGQDVTGKYGLGFKSVHLIADEARLASGLGVACQISGGFLPSSWIEGPAAVRDYTNDKAPATVLELPTGDGREDEAENAIAAFKRVAHLLPAFSRRIRRVELSGDDAIMADIKIDSLGNVDGVSIVGFSGSTQLRALRFDLGEGAQMLVALDRDGPCAFDADLPKLWSLAPLDEDLPAGWILNVRDLPLDPGRTSLADREHVDELFVNIGTKLGTRLETLHGYASNNWTEFSSYLGLSDSGLQTGSRVFWDKMLDLFERDLDNKWTKKLHDKERGVGRLIVSARVLSSRLPAPFDALVQGADVKFYPDGVLAIKDNLAGICDWQSAKEISGQVVSKSVSDTLQAMGFDKIQPLSIAALLLKEIGDGAQVSAEKASILGRVINEEWVKSLDSHKDQQELRTAAARSRFLMADGQWREAGLSPIGRPRNKEEDLIMAFAPETAILDGGYRQEPALGFFRLASEQSGFQRNATVFAKWGMELASEEKQKAFLAYMIDGDLGEKFADAVRNLKPIWLPKSSVDLKNSPLVSGWSEDDISRLLTRLFPVEVKNNWFNPNAAGPESQPDSLIEPDVFFENLYEWWGDKGEDLRSEHDKQAYPEGFVPSQLIGQTANDDREGWFTFFALAMFRSIGRTNEGQHRVFIEKGRQIGWWRELANSTPPNDVEAWTKQLNEWSSPDVWRLDNLPWRRYLSDLYTLARWLPDYVEALLALPLGVSQKEKVALSDAFRLSTSPIWQRRGLEGAPLTQSLGIGANWLIRECCRHGIYERGDAVAMHKYGWASTRRVRDLFDSLSISVGDNASMDHSHDIHSLVVEFLGSERAMFHGDLDLALQSITLEKFGGELQGLLGSEQNAGAPVFESEVFGQETDE